MPLESFAAKADPHGGEVRLNWSYPDVFTGQIHIFKRADNAVTDDEITKYVAGELSNTDLAERGIFVFRTIPATANGITDFAVENARTYKYRATLIDTQAKTFDTPLEVSIAPRADVTIAVVDGKTLVLRAVEKVLDAARTVNNGNLPFLVDAHVRVFRDHATRKEEEVFCVVQRTSGQSLERYFDSVLAEYGDYMLKGEVDLDTFTVEWVCISGAQGVLRRDKLTNIFRGLRPLLRRYILKMGNGLVRDVKVIPTGDAEGKYSGSEAIKGGMAVQLVIESQMQIGRDVLYEVQYNEGIPI